MPPLILIEQVLLVHEKSKGTFSRVFDLESTDMNDVEEDVESRSPFESRFPINVGITGYVATTGEVYVYLFRHFPKGTFQFSDVHLLF